MKYLSIVVFSLFTFFASAQEVIKTKEGEIKIHPIIHGTLAIEHNGLMIYIDPYGGAERFKGLKNADLILITDIHGDHLNTQTLRGLPTANTHFIVPQAVADKMDDIENSEIEVIQNGGSSEFKGIQIRATPMYNLPETEDSRHPKGRGNGYILTIADKQIYISGDTEDIPEMRSLEKIDLAFVCMNLPYTMSVEQAADAVLDFRPTIVYPFHFRGTEGLADVEKFKSLVENKSKEIEVRLRDWYPKP